MKNSKAFQFFFQERVIFKDVCITWSLFYDSYIIVQ